MAKISADVSLDMVNARFGDGILVSASSTSFEVDYGFATSIFYGSGFRFDSFGLFDGFITSFEQYDSRDLLTYQASELTVRASAVADAIDRNDLPTLFFQAGGGRDDIIGSDRDDNLLGYEGNDFISSGFGDNFIDGGSGLDYAIYDGRGSDYALGRISGGFSLTRFDGAVDDRLYNVERMFFDDGTLAFDSNATQGYRLYQAAFDRTPDRAGLSFWVDELDDGVSLFSVAAAFIGSREFTDLYGRSPSDEAFINLLYENVLNRQADAGGYAFWLNEIDNGATRAEILVDFSESTENQQNVAGAIAGGVWLDNAYLFG